MRLVILQVAAGTSEHALVRGILAGERVLASRGVTLTECLEAFAAEARKQPPNASHISAFEDADHAARVAAFGSIEQAGDALLGLLLGPGDVMPDLSPARQRQHA